MKTTISRLNLPFLILLFGLFAIACSKDKDDDPIPEDTTNQLEHDGKKYTFKSGLIEDFGKGSLYSNGDTHHNYDYTIIDGTFTKKADNTYTPASASTSVLVYAELLSPGITGFNTGTFTYINDSDDEELTASELETKYKDKAYFNLAYILIDSNNSKSFDQGDTGLIVTGGTIKVSGSVSNPTLDYDFTLSDGKTLRGSYSGNFTFSN